MPRERKNEISKSTLLRDMKKVSFKYIIRQLKQLLIFEILSGNRIR